MARMPRKTILISAYRDFSVRYLLYSDVLETLLGRFSKIVLLVKDSDVEFYRRRFADPKIIVEPVLYDQSLRILKETFFARLIVILRKCFAGGTKEIRNSTTKSRVFLYRREFADAAWRYRASLEAILLVAKLAERYRPIRRVILFVEEILYPGRQYDNLIRVYRPDVVVTSSLGYMIDPFLMRASRRKKIPCVSIIHSWDNTSTKDYRGASPDLVITWNALMSREVEIFHDINPIRIRVGGIAHWDVLPRFSEENLGLKEAGNFLNPVYELGCDANRPIIYYGTSSFKIFPETADVVQALCCAIEEGRIVGHPQLVVRLHPSYLYESAREQLLRFKADCAETSAKYPQTLFLDLPRMPKIPGGLDMPLTDMVRHMRMLKESTVLLTEYSTLMIEAAIFDVPIVNVGFGRYRDTDKSASYVEQFTHVKRVLKTGACRNAYSFDELCDALSESITHPEVRACQRQLLVDQELEINSGDAGKRIGRILSELA